VLAHRIAKTVPMDQVGEYRRLRTMELRVCKVCAEDRISAAPQSPGGSLIDAEVVGDLAAQIVAYMSRCSFSIAAIASSVIRAHAIGRQQSQGLTRLRQVSNVGLGKLPHARAAIGQQLISPSAAITLSASRKGVREISNFSQSFAFGNSAARGSVPSTIKITK